MKKAGKPVIITLLLLAGLTFGGYYLLTKGDGNVGGLATEIKQQQSDLLTEKAYQIDLEQSAEELKTSGAGKNVVDFKTRNQYNLQVSTAARERLDHLVQRTSPSLSEPVIVRNPFGTWEETMLFSFHTSSAGMIRYTITVADQSIPDYVRYVNNGKENNLSKEHEFVVNGFVPGKTNYLILEFLDGKGASREKKVYKYNAPTSQAAASINHEETKNSEKPKNGLYAVMPSGDKNIYFYDNSGMLRNTIVTESAHGSRFYQVGDSLLYQVTPTKVAKVSGTGQVTVLAEVKGYGNIMDFSYDGYDNIYSLGSKKGVYYLLGTSFQSGKTVKLFRFPKGIVPGSLTTPSGGSVYVCCSSPSGIVKLKGLTSENPKVSFVLGKKEAWKNTKWKKKVGKDTTVPKWNMSGTVLYTDQRGSDKGKDSITAYLLDGNKGTGVQFAVDGEKKSVEIANSYPVGEDGRCTCEAYEGHFLIANRNKGVYTEYDIAGLVSRRFRFGKALDSVTKVSLEGICYYAG